MMDKEQIEQFFEERGFPRYSHCEIRDLALMALRAAPEHVAGAEALAEVVRAGVQCELLWRKDAFPMPHGTKLYTQPAHGEREAVAWRCFHCDEVFTNKDCAAEHFGRDESREAACQIKAGAERSMVKALRTAEDAAAKAWDAVHSESTDAAQAYHAQASRHRAQLQATEELGYERGLLDGIAEGLEGAAKRLATLEFIILSELSGEEAYQRNGRYISLYGAEHAIKALAPAKQPEGGDAEGRHA